ncbi:hypothetical protein [Actinokineospora sp.]|uniref:hypothetical protein n=1 Tax=Actinokineospora sp. TaxID=1872133 RepID=UPI004038389A
MTAGFGEVRMWDAEPLHTATGELNGRCTLLLGLADEVDAVAATPSWMGETAVSAADRLRLLRDGLEDDLAEVAALRQAMGETADAVSGLRNGIAEIDYLAQAHDFRVADDGVVHDNGPRDVPGDERARADLARERERIRVESATSTACPPQTGTRPTAPASHRTGATGGRTRPRPGIRRCRGVRAGDGQAQGP